MTVDVEVKVAASLKRALLNKHFENHLMPELLVTRLVWPLPLGRQSLWKLSCFMNINSHVQQFIKMLLKDHSKRQTGMLVDGMDLLIGMLLAEWIFDRSYEFQVRPPLLTQVWPFGYGRKQVKKIIITIY